MKNAETARDAPQMSSHAEVERVESRLRPNQGEHRHDSKDRTKNPLSVRVKQVSRVFKPFNPLRWRKRYRRVSSSFSVYRAALREQTTARDILKEAESALNRALIDVDEVWKFIHAARAAEILEDAQALPTWAIVFRREADKLTAWRKNAIYDLLGSLEKPKEAQQLTTRNVYRAACLIYEHYDNQAYKNKLLESHKRQLLTILAFTVLAVFWWFRTISVPFWWFGFQEARWLVSPFVSAKPFGIMFEEAYTAQMLVPVALFGLLGAVVSAITKFPASSEVSRIPEITASLSVTFLRLFMGGASAAIVYIFLGSSLARNVLTLDPKTMTSSTIFALSIVAGFSERLVTRAIEAVSDPKKESPK